MKFNIPKYDSALPILTMLLFVAATGFTHAQVSGDSRGKQLFQKLKCVECHSVGGSGGCLGPALDGVMDHRDRAYVRLRLNEGDERAFVELIGHPELLPHPRFNKAEVTELMNYLCTLPAAEHPYALHHEKSHTPLPASEHKSTEQTITEGKKLFYDSGCMSCHSIGKVGGQVGPGLDNVATRMKKSEIINFIANPSGKRMPKITLTPEQRQKIGDFLETCK